MNESNVWRVSHIFFDAQFIFIIYYYCYHQGTFDRNGNHYLININYWPFMMRGKSLPIEFNGIGSLRFGDMFKSLGVVIIYMRKVPRYP